MDDKTTPLEVRAPEGARQLEIDWADGHTGIYPHRILRGFCPCAHCQGHQGPIRFVEGGDLELRGIDEAGQYALRFLWGDGHGTGIYHYAFLRSLCACRACAASGDPASRVYGR